MSFPLNIRKGLNVQSRREQTTSTPPCGLDRINIVLLFIQMNGQIPLRRAFKFILSAFDPELLRVKVGFDNLDYSRNVC